MDYMILLLFEETNSQFDQIYCVDILQGLIRIILTWF